MKVLWAIGLAVAMLFATSARAQVGESIAAVVNDDVITTYDVRQRAALLLASVETEPTDELMQLARAQALQDLIDERLQMQEVGQFEQIQISDEEVDFALANIAQQRGMDLEENLQTLRDVGVREQTLRDQVRAQIAWDTLVTGRYRDRVRIGDDQIDEALRMLAQSLQETQYRVAEIFIGINSVAEEEEARQRTLTVIEQLRQGGSFPVLAQQYSDSETGPRGGDMGFQPLNQFPAEVAEQVAQLPAGGVAGPIRSLGGYYIVALIEKREPGAAIQLTLKSIVQPAPEGATAEEISRARARLAAATAESPGCAAADSLAAELDGAFVSDLGTLSAASLQPQVRSALAAIEPGQATAVLDSAIGAQVFLLCDRSIGGAGLPSRDEVSARMQDQRRAMLSRRYLRDLRREAAIEIY